MRPQAIPLLMPCNQAKDLRRTALWAIRMHAGDEEVQYVYLELPKNLPAGTKLAIEVSSTPRRLACGRHGTMPTWDKMHSLFCVMPVPCTS